MFLKKTPKQEVKLYIEAQKRVKNVTVIDDALVYYIKRVFKSKEKYVDFSYIDDLIASGIDINYITNNRENILFQVKNFFGKNYFFN